LLRKYEKKQPCPTFWQLRKNWEKDIKHNVELSPVVWDMKQTIGVEMKLIYSLFKLENLSLMFAVYSG